MGIYKTKFNPFSKSLQWVLKGTLITFKEAVSTYNNLPITGNSQNEARITDDTGHLYVWGIEESSGLLTDWIDQGDIVNIAWDSIDGKPSSTPANIDDAVDKKHEHTNKTTLDTYTQTESNLADAVSKKHSQNTDTKLDEGGSNEVSASELVRALYNIVLLAFYRAIDSAKIIYNLINGIIDEYEDESGIDTINSLNEVYDSDGDYYKPVVGSEISVSPYAHYKLNDDELNFVVIDDGTGDNNGTASTNTSDLSVIGKINDCFEFVHANSEYINIDSLQADTTGDSESSFSFWVYPNSQMTNIVFSFGDTNGENLFECYWDIDNGGTFYVYTYAKAIDDYKWAFKATGYASGNWYHIVITHDSLEPKIYINNSLIDSYISTTDMTYWLNDFGILLDNGRIGCREWANLGNSGFFDGKIDDFRYYKSVLSVSDVSLLYNNNNGTEADKPASETLSMTLISDTFEAESEPSTARIIAFEEDVDVITLNTDLKAYISKDDGSTWAEVTLSDEGNYDATKRILVGNVDLSLSGIGSGTDMRYEFQTANAKDLKLHGTGLLWD